MSSDDQSYTIGIGLMSNNSWWNGDAWVPLNNRSNSRNSPTPTTPDLTDGESAENTPGFLPGHDELNDREMGNGRYEMTITFDESITETEDEAEIHLYLTDPIRPLNDGLILSTEQEWVKYNWRIAAHNGNNWTSVNEAIENEVVPSDHPRHDAALQDVRIAMSL
ncbi:uncharacterized protein I206_106751 [Kwoniella pini CBS 10737]|uniref:Uncharacterized protein n=1 Tax=Kwoniella pini CBS 10737 TaxID=1296096 RepID=A0A1B9HTB7_9TREE|nr:uncharacterized protein I206_07361 [Kwoniella pini CBS 10737]OCF46508.1 hypothetical protein I206_07361 [Kwoniella pini CBS 10737]